MNCRTIPDNFLAAVERGLSKKELREEFQVRHMTISEWLEALGVMAASDPNGRRPDFRKVTADMMPIDAVEYLHGVIDDLLPPFHALDLRRKMGFTHIQCDMLNVLCRFDYLGVEQATAICMRGRDYDLAPSREAVRQHVTTMRRRFRELEFAVEIKADRIRGSQLGWQLVREAGFRFPWEAR